MMNRLQPAKKDEKVWFRLRQMLKTMMLCNGSEEQNVLSDKGISKVTRML